MAHPCKHVVSKETSYISLNDSLAAMQVNHYTVLDWARHFRRGWTLTYSARTDQLIPSPERIYYTKKIMVGRGAPPSKNWRGAAISPRANFVRFQPPITARGRE